MTLGHMRYTAADIGHWLLGLASGWLGYSVADITSVPTTPHWYDNTLFKLVVGGCFSVISVCLAKVVEVRLKDKIERRNRQ